MGSFIERARSYRFCTKMEFTKHVESMSAICIVFSLMVFLGFFKFALPNVFYLNLAWLASIALLLYYFFLEWRLAAALVPIFAIMNLIAEIFTFEGPSAFGFWIAGMFFIVGLACHFFSHYYEGSKASWKFNFPVIIIAPMVLVAEIFFACGKLTALKSKMAR